MKIIFDPAPIEATARRAPASPLKAAGPPRAAAPQPARTAVQARPAAPASAVPAVVARPAAAAKDFGYTLMQREMQEMRRVLETGMAGMTWNDKRLREPLKAQVLEQLSALDIAPDVDCRTGATPHQS
jgi:hypothetical protein